MLGRFRSTADWNGPEQAHRLRAWIHVSEIAVGNMSELQSHPLPAAQRTRDLNRGVKLESGSQVGAVFPLIVARGESDSDVPIASGRDMQQQSSTKKP